MDDKRRTRFELECLYDMFRDRIEENVIYIVYTENDGKIDTTIDQLMSISACSLTGYHFEPPKSLAIQPVNGVNNNEPTTFASTLTTTTANCGGAITRSQTNTILRQQHLDGQRRLSEVSTNSAPSTTATGSSGDDKAKESEVNEDQDDADQYGDDEQLSLDERIANLQSSINDILEEKNKCHDKAAQYLSKKMYPVTSYYSELGSQYRRMVENKTTKLVDLLLLKSENADTIDLHGLNPIQARLVVSRLLSIRQEKLLIDKQGETCVDIITGWGKHTVTSGHQKVRPAIVTLLRENGFEFNHLNKGALRVTIRR